MEAYAKAVWIKHPVDLPDTWHEAQGAAAVGGGAPLPAAVLLVSYRFSLQGASALGGEG